MEVTSKLPLSELLRNNASSLTNESWQNHVAHHLRLRDFKASLAAAASAVSSAAVAVATANTNNGDNSSSSHSSLGSESSTNATAHDPQQDSKPLTDAQLHRVMLAPWVLGVILQAIFYGIVVSQVHTTFANRKWISCRLLAAVALLFITNSASFCAQSSVLWFFSMSSLGEVKLIMLKFPLGLLVDLWLTPVTMGICNLCQIHFTFLDSGKRKWVLLPLVPLWVVEVISSLLNMVLTTKVFRSEAVNTELWGYASYVHLLSRVTVIMVIACLRLYFGLRAIKSLRSCSDILKVADLVFASDILGVIPAGIEAGTVLREWRLSVAANVAYTSTPRVCTSAFLASLAIYFEREQDAEQAEAENGQAKINLNIEMAIPSARPRPQDDSIDLA